MENVDEGRRRRLQNLKPYAKGRSKEEAVKAGRLGGYASGKARSLKKIALEKLAAGAGDEILDAMIKQAKKGNVKAAEFVRDTSGQKPKEEIEVNDVTDRAKKLEELVRGN